MEPRALVIAGIFAGWMLTFGYYSGDLRAKEGLEAEVEEQQSEIEDLQRLVRRVFRRPNAEDRKMEALYGELGFKELERWAMRDVLIEALRGS